MSLQEAKPMTEYKIFNLGIAKMRHTPLQEEQCSVSLGHWPHWHSKQRGIRRTIHCQGLDIRKPWQIKNIMWQCGMGINKMGSSSTSGETLHSFIHPNCWAAKENE